MRSSAASCSTWLAPRNAVPRSRPSGSPPTRSGTPRRCACKGAELHQMQHSVLGVRAAWQGLRRYRAAGGPAGRRLDTPWSRGSWPLVALDDRMWRPDRLGWVTGGCTWRTCRGGGMGARRGTLALVAADGAVPVSPGAVLLEEML